MIEKNENDNARQVIFEEEGNFSHGRSRIEDTEDPPSSLLASWTKGWAARECDMKVSWREQNRSFKFHYSKDDARRCLSLHATCYIFSERECRLIISRVSITLDEVRKKMYNFFQFFESLFILRFFCWKILSILTRYLF